PTRKASVCVQLRRDLPSLDYGTAGELAWQAIARCQKGVQAALIRLRATTARQGNHSYRLKSGAYLYLGISRCASPLPRGFTGHVVQPVRSIRSRMLANEARGSVLPHGANRRSEIQWRRAFLVR